jgi:hypothetical protein
MNKRAMTINGFRPRPRLHGPSIVRAKHDGLELIRAAADRIEAIIGPDQRN